MIFDCFLIEEVLFVDLILGEVRVVVEYVLVDAGTCIMLRGEGFY